MPGEYLPVITIILNYMLTFLNKFTQTNCYCNKKKYYDYESLNQACAFHFRTAFFSSACVFHCLGVGLVRLVSNRQNEPNKQNRESQTEQTEQTDHMDCLVYWTLVRWSVDLFGLLGVIGLLWACGWLCVGVVGWRGWLAWLVGLVGMVGWHGWS